KPSAKVSAWLCPGRQLNSWKMPNSITYTPPRADGRAWRVTMLARSRPPGCGPGQSSTLVTVYPMRRARSAEGRGPVFKFFSMMWRGIKNALFDRVSPELMAQEAKEEVRTSTLETVENAQAAEVQAVKAERMLASLMAEREKARLGVK